MSVTQQIAIGAATRARTNAEEIAELRAEVAGLKRRVAELEALLPIGTPPEWLTAPELQPCLPFPTAPPTSLFRP